MKNYIKYIFNILLLLSLIILNSNSYSYAEKPALDINSPVAILMDATTGQVLYEKDAYSKYYPASITKLMTALLTIESLEPTDTITFSRNAVFNIEFGSSHIGIREGEILTIDQALHGLLLMSANEVANGLAEEVSGSTNAFAEDMNSRAKALGALNTNFTNPHGLHDEEHYSTAYDMALIANELVKHDYFLSIMKDLTYQIPTTNKVEEIRYLSQQHKLMNYKRDATLYREDVIGGKTGYTDEAKHTIVTISQSDDRILIAVILNAGKDYMYADTNLLLDYGYNNYKNVTIEPSSYTESLSIMENDVIAGDATVTLKAPIQLSIPKDVDKSELTYSAELPSTLDKGVMKDNSIGTISFYYEDTLLNTEELVVNEIISDPVKDTVEEVVEPNKTNKLLIIIIGAIFIIFCGFLLYYKYHNTNHYRRFKRRKNLIDYRYK